MLNFFFNIDVLYLTVIASILPFLLSLILGPKLIAVLTAMKAGQPIRQACQGVNAPEHQGKVGTPTMGGIMIIGIILLTTLLFGQLNDPLIQCTLFVLIITAGLGAMDDYAKITKNSSDGVSAWFKIGLQTLAAAGVAFYCYYCVGTATLLYIPAYGIIDIGPLFIPLAIIAIIGSSNAVNLTDGLDGLASGCMFIVCCGMAIIAASNSSAIMLITIAFACLGFLWFNCNPAKIFMGDTGSLALGGMLGTIAVCSGQAIILVIVGAVFVAEALSVMLQVSYFKHTKRKYGEGRRLFLMAPLHHHFEKKGWKETQISVRLWTITIFCTLLGILGYYTSLAITLSQSNS